MKKLNDIVFGGIYEYRDKDNRIIYRGSTEFEGLIEERRSPDWYHREGHVTHTPKKKYYVSVFRSNLRRPIAKKHEWKIQWCVQPKEMTREELLKLEGEKIQEAIDNCECILNHTPDPLKTWKKYEK